MKLKVNGREKNMNEERIMRELAKRRVFFSVKNLPVMSPSIIFAWNSTHGMDLSGSIGERNAS